jgi:hypothetical protein
VTTDLAALREQPFAGEVEELTDLLDQGNRVFLFGAGSSKCAGLPLMAELTNQALATGVLSAPTKELLDALKSAFEGAANPNIEDYLSELVDCLAIANRRRSRGATSSDATVGSCSCSIEALQTAIDEIKQAVADAIGIDATLGTHRRFVRAVHRSLRPGRAPTGQSVDYLVLNYDRLIEDALGLERVPFADGMEGGSTAWWNPETLDRNDVSARVFKMHGSIDWRESPDDSLPVRVAAGVDASLAASRRIMIWPASTKYRETQLDPYAQIAERVRKLLHPAEGSHRVVVVCGYSFGDSHINIEIDRALRESQDRVTVIVLSSDEQPVGQVKTWLDDPGVRDHVVVLARRGFFHGEHSDVAKTDLPWWTFDTFTRLLEGEQ